MYDVLYDSVRVELAGHPRARHADARLPVLSRAEEEEEEDLANTQRDLGEGEGGRSGWAAGLGWDGQPAARLAESGAATGALATRAPSQEPIAENGAAGR